MKKMTAVIRIDVMVPDTASEWQLYANEPGAARAAKALAAGVRKVLKDKTAGTNLHQSVKTHVFPVMSKYANFGAWDTEPMWVLRDTLAKAYGEDRVERAL